MENENNVNLSLSANQNKDTKDHQSSSLSQSNQDEESESKSFFGPNFRKWLRMKRALRLVHEEDYPEKIHIPRIQYKIRQFWVDSLYEGVESQEDELYPGFQGIIHRAVMNRDPHQLKELLNQGVNPNYRLGRCNRTLLHYACLKGDRDIIGLLLEYGANAKTRDLNGDTAMSLSLTYNPQDAHVRLILFIFSCLWERGININQRNKKGWTVLHRACLIGEPRIIKWILDYGAKVYTLTKKDNLVPLQLVKRNHEEILHLFASQTPVPFLYHSAAHPDSDSEDDEREEREKMYLDHVKMWAHIISRDFVATLFELVEPNCVVCKRKTRKCGQMKKENYRYWLLIHHKKPR